MSTPSSSAGRSNCNSVAVKFGGLLKNMIKWQSIIAIDDIILLKISGYPQTRLDGENT